jgi:WS/DGAT/MGAT family acyltransferase
VTQAGGLASRAPVRTPLAHVDATWLRMDEPTNPMVVTGVLVLDAPLPLAAVRHLIETRLTRFTRFTERVVESASGVGPPAWEVDPHFSVDHHLSEAPLAAPGDEGALRALVSRLVSQPFDRARPLWHFHLVPHYQGGCAIVGRIHHCIGDGLALIHVMLSIADGGPEPPPASGDATADGEGDLSLWDLLGQSISDTAAAASTLPAALLQEATALLGDPERLADTTTRIASALGAFSKLVLIPPDPQTPLKGPLGAEKTVAWSPPIPIDVFNRIGRVTGSTINDILMATMSGALRQYLLRRGEVPPGLNVRGVVPVNLRAPEDAYRLGNEFGLVFLPLPLGIDDPLERLFEVRRRMRAIKDTPEASVAFQVLNALALVPQPMFDVVVRLFGAKATAVVTNVVGPRTAVAFAGARLRQPMFWVPCAGHLGLGISLLSYAGHVWLGVQADASLVPAPEHIVEGFQAEVEALSALEQAAGQ